MRFSRFPLSCMLASMLTIPTVSFAAGSETASSAPSFASQSGGSENRNIPAPRPGGSRTLEVAPQRSDGDRSPAVGEIPSGRELRPGNDAAALKHDFHPGDSAGGSRADDPKDDRRPYLGIELEYASQCYMGMEEHGFEVLNVYPNSPAAAAGLHGRKSSTASGDLAALASLIFLPVAFVAIPHMRHSGALGTGGDLIVAVDDQRVRNEKELTHALDHLRPGDTTYLTVIRPVIGGTHQTLRVALKIDREIIPYSAKPRVVSPRPEPPTESAVE